MDKDREGGYGSHMGTRQRLAGFAVILLLAFTGGWGIGRGLSSAGDGSGGTPEPTATTTPPVVAEHEGGHQ